MTVNQSYSSTLDCAAQGCEKTIRGGETLLRRISPKGGPFIGLCQNHFGRTVVLKPEAAALMGTERN